MKTQRFTFCFISYLLTVPLLSYLFLAGCQSNKLDKSLAKDNPFSHEQKSESIEILACQGNTYRYPSEINLSKILSSASFTLKTKEESPKAFTWLNQSTWSENGLDIYFVGSEHWESLKILLEESNVSQTSQTKYFIRNTDEVAEFEMTSVDNESTFFIKKDNGQLRGYTIAQGDCLFRVNGTPLNNTLQTSQDLLLNIVPLFKSNIKQTGYQLQKDRKISIVDKTQMVVFEDMLTSGQIPANTFIIILKSNKNEGIGNIGRYFLSDQNQSDVYNLMLILQPQRVKMNRNVSENNI